MKGLPAPRMGPAYRSQPAEAETLTEIRARSEFWALAHFP
jgi:hypothetical protein